MYRWIFEAYVLVIYTYWTPLLVALQKLYTVQMHDNCIYIGKLHSLDLKWRLYTVNMYFVTSIYRTYPFWSNFICNFETKDLKDLGLVGCDPKELYYVWNTMLCLHVLILKKRAAGALNTNTMIKKVYLMPDANIYILTYTRLKWRCFTFIQKYFVKMF